MPDYIREVAERIQGYIDERNHVHSQIAELRQRAEALTGLIQANHKYAETLGYKLEIPETYENVSVKRTIQHGQTSRELVLEVLKEHPEGLTPSEIGEILNNRYSNLQKRAVTNGLYLLKEDRKIRKVDKKYVVEETKN